MKFIDVVKDTNSLKANKEKISKILDTKLTLLLLK